MSWEKVLGVEGFFVFVVLFIYFVMGVLHVQRWSQTAEMGWKVMKKKRG